MVQIVRRRLVVPGLFLAVIMIFFGYIFSQYSHASQNKIDPNAIEATYFPQPRPVTDFSLIDDDNHAFSQKDLAGHWTLMFFGFTHCPYMCPTTMTELKKSYATIEKTPSLAKPQILMVSVDPDRDSVKEMHRYVKKYNQAFRGATGTQQQIDKLAHDMSVLYMKVKTDTGVKNDYTINHSGAIMLINPQGELAAVFNMPHEATEIEKDYAYIVSRA